MAGAKALRLGVAVLAAVALAGCGGGGKIGGGNNSGQASKKLVLIPGVKAEPFYISMRCGAEEEAKKRGYELTEQAPDKFEAGLQTPIVTGVLATKPGGVLIAPTDDKAMARPMADLKNAGIKVVEVDTKVTDASISVSKISSNNEQGGRKAAETLAKLVGEKGSVLVLNTKAGTSTTDMRAKGFEEEIKKYPNIKYLGQQYTDNEPAKAAQIVSSTLSANPDLAGVFATNLNTGEGASTGLRNAGKTGAVKLVGFDASPKQVDELRKGGVDALIAQDPAGIGRRGVEQAVSAIEGKSTEGEIQTDLVAITRDDMDQQSKYFYKTTC
ncbi:ABC transporter substrate-binding protein [Streptoalloteichus hindustanus]|uniref:Monosaccharide ABC transporter substrate-binding protein, CUT2 family n=1 Tax=Streptoalloteichus hindustanus TaxID=2017 RepID=A0A1M5GHP6_STRHI|nr:ABC transporter substrate-binding protein [Streptoalloteichus hindustanus]SHG03249.1 monosaccharide ABC transporter substrate-binding protein, CUT2 family [Streptoalloteichus hindustanus]